jgi:SPP1 gp7 family putative phage head morphogenesis protein
VARKRSFTQALVETVALRGQRDLTSYRLKVAQAETIAPGIPAAAMLGYSKAMDRYYARVQKLVDRHVLRQLRRGAPAPGALQVGLAALQIDMLELAEKTRRPARTAGRRASRHASQEVSRILNMRVPPGAQTNALIEDFAARSVDLVRKLAAAQVKQLELVISQHSGPGLLEKLQEATWVARNRSQLIARDQVYKFQAQQISYWSRAVGSEAYLYITRLDDRVRATHRAHHGKVFSWAVAPSTGHPGTEVACRCVAVPVEALKS